MAERKQAFVSNDKLNFGFTSKEVSLGIRPQCVFCVEVLTHSSLKSAELRRHLEAKVLNTLINL